MLRRARQQEAKAEETAVDKRRRRTYGEATATYEQRSDLRVHVALRSEGSQPPHEFQELQGLSWTHRRRQSFLSGGQDVCGHG